VIRWEQGRADIERLLATGQLTRVHASRDLADSYLEMARKHLAAVGAIGDVDPAGAFVLTYESARLGLAAILVNQGLRPRGHGAHAVLLEAVLAQLEPPRQKEFREFAWMRPLRNATQYPSAENPVATGDDLAQAIPAADAIISRSETLLLHMPPF
jgi:hypothetical protein